MRYSKLRKAMLTLLFAFGVGFVPVRAQSIDQLLEQLALDVQKLSELRTILQDMYDGYQVIDKGYTGVRDIVRDNFNLHKTFLDALLTVSPAVRQYYRVGAILDMEQSILREQSSAERNWRNSGVFTGEELAYLQQVYKGVSGRAGKYLDRLSMVATDAEMRMSDAERIQAIDGIYLDVSRDLDGLRRFNDGVGTQVLQRVRESKNINLLKSTYGNP